MFVELHILQNFAPSNLNRDDTGAPKDCEFGGYRRARISSQCLKRAMRASFRELALLPADRLAARTKRLVEELTRRLSARGHAEAEARAVTMTVLRGIGLEVVEDDKTQYLLFLGEAEIAALAALCDQHWSELAPIALAAPAAEEPAGGRGRRGGAREAKRAGKEALPPALQNKAKNILDGGRAADLALFGRMLADLPDRNIDAASQVAHAISTNRVSMEFDFYTAVDDLKPEDTAGADMLGTVEFTSACFYRYANVDLDQLHTNLDGDEELARQTLGAFLRAAVAAVPTGKQNSMAAHNPPSLVLAVARQHGLCSLANAFLTPIRPDERGNLVQHSVAALDAYWGKLAGMYGTAGLLGTWLTTTEPDRLAALKAADRGSVDAVVASVLEAATFNGRRLA
jgi:CRISPR system Cascade subunit CasC